MENLAIEDKRFGVPIHIVDASNKNTVTRASMGEMKFKMCGSDAWEEKGRTRLS